MRSDSVCGPHVADPGQLWSGGSRRREAAGEMYSCGLLGSINDHVSPMYPDADPMPRPPGPWRARRETPARQQQRMAVAHPCQMPDSVAVWDGDSRSCVAGSSRLSGVPERQQAAATGGCCGGRSAPAKIRLFACSPAPSISAVSRAVVCTCSHGRVGREVLSRYECYSSSPRTWIPSL